MITLLRNQSTLVRSGTIALDEFLEKVMAKTSHQGKFRILAVGSGTGGTGRYIVPHFQKLGVPFKYIFPDLSPSLVSAAKRTFKDCPEMTFATLDIEKEPPADWVASFHVATMTNCIHATHDQMVSLTSLRADIAKGPCQCCKPIADMSFSVTPLGVVYPPKYDRVHNSFRIVSIKISFNDPIC